MNLKTLIALAAVCAFGGARAEQLPAKLFAQKPVLRDLAMSPDGRHLALTNPVENRTDLTIIDLSGKEDARRIRYLPKEHVLSPIWVDDERLIVGKGFDVGGLEEPRSAGELYATNTQAKEQRMLFGYQPDQGIRRGIRKDQGFAHVISRVPSAPGEVYVQFHSWSDSDKNTYIYRANAETGERKLVEKISLERANVVQDHNGRARFASTVDDQLAPVLRYRPNADSEWTAVPKTLAGFDMGVEAFLPDNNTAYARISDEGEAYVLYRVDFAKGTREKVLSYDGYSTGGLLFAGFDPSPFAVISYTPRVSVQYLDTKSPWAGLHAGLMKQFPGNIVHFLDFSRDDQKVLVWVSGDRNPGAYYLLDRSKNSVAKVYDLLEGLPADQLATTRVLEFTTRDETKLDALLTLPKTGAAPYPMVVLVHGGPFGIRDVWGFDTDAQFLANRGYAVLQVNFRGSAGRGSDFEESGYRKWGTTMMDDIADGVKFAIEQQVADKDRICTFGASFGGYAALMNPIRHPDLYRCAVGYAGVYNLNYMATKGDINNTKRGRNYVQMAVGEDEATLNAESPVFQVDKLRVPVMLIHGKDDQRVPFKHFQVMEDALSKAGRAPVTLVKDGEEHGFYKDENNVELYEKLQKFLDQHIGSKAH